MEQQENGKSINGKGGKELLEAIKNSKIKVSSVTIEGQRGKKFNIKDSPLFFQIVKVEKKGIENDEKIPVSFPKKNNHNTIHLVIKFWNKDLFISLKNYGFNVGYNSLNDLSDFYVIVLLDKVKNFISWDLDKKKKAENY